tara:strand:- start:560 stop:784 length:225 start_codon:yes stop_codon:yes gene_type:complete
MIESRRRSLVKSMSWRITATITTTIISFVITGNISLALQIGLFELIAKMGLYYFHERLWVKIKFGLKSNLDYQI